eukprot:TRINITY_DN11410_c0_g2_i1.p2 TRINITY_DN11410_c0_g2~~TRINITY_DN11410_c0_g2_i1.p2  ORF type:complete len:121 (+),score=19.67 TRINITY_DN11410_c0_g2_i1:105-467(+)
MLLEERSSCNKCLFRKKGLLLLGLFTILVGITAVVTSKIVWPVIVAAYEGTQAQLANATELADFSFDNLTNTTEIICNFTLDKVIKEKNGMTVFDQNNGFQATGDTIFGTKRTGDLKELG